MTAETNLPADEFERRDDAPPVLHAEQIDAGPQLAQIAAYQPELDLKVRRRQHSPPGICSRPRKAGRPARGCPFGRHARPSFPRILSKASA